MHSSMMRTAHPLTVRGVVDVLTRSDVAFGVTLTPLPPSGLGQTDACENITFACFSMWAVKIQNYIAV